MSGWIVLVMPFRQYVTKARQEGFKVCSVWDPRLESPSYLREVAAGSDELILTDFADEPGFRRVLTAAVRDHDARWLYHAGREDSMLTAYEVAKSLDVSANPTSAIRLLNDKLAMRSLLAAHGVSPVRFATVPSWRDVAGVLDRFTLPVVVKPTALAGSRGVLLLHRRADLAGWGLELESYGYDDPVLVEEYLRGPEFSVESMSFDGSHHVAGITRKELGIPPLFVEMGHVHPAPLPSPMRDAMVELTSTLLDLAGYRNGPAHTEIIWTGDGPRLVESQARLGGDRIFRLVELATGVDLERAMFTVLAGHRPALAPQRCGVARIAYFQFRPGVLESIGGLDEAAALPFVHDLHIPFAPGDVVPPVRDSKSRHGYVIVTGDTHRQAAANLAEVRRLLHPATTAAPTPSELAGSTA